MGALAIGLGAVSDWYRNWDINTWFGRGGDNSPVQPDPPATDGKSSDGAVISDGINNGISILSAKLPVSAYDANGVSVPADTVYVLTATVEPTFTTNRAVDWAISWTDPESAWASGKTVVDYITVSPSSDGALTAVVECKRAFGAQAVITVVSRDDSTLSATCFVDYTEKALGAEFHLCYVFGGPEQVFNGRDSVESIFAIGDKSDAAVNYNGTIINTSDCTLKDTYTMTIEIEPTAAYNELVPFPSNSKKYTKSLDNLKGNTAIRDANTSRDWFFRDSVMNEIFGLNVHKTSQFYAAMGDSGIKNQYGCITVRVTATGEYSTYTCVTKAVFNQSAVVVSATDVSLSDGNIVF